MNIVLTTEDRDPRGGLSAKGRAKYNRLTGSRLKPGVRVVRTTEDMRRKASFLRRFYARSSIPALVRDGKPTRYALAAWAWGEPVPKTQKDVRRLAEKGERLLKTYHARTR